MAARRMVFYSRSKASSTYTPKDKDGLLFAAPLRKGANTIRESGGYKVIAPSTQVVDADGSYIHPVSKLITPAQANILRIGGGIDLASRDKGALFEGARTNSCLQSEDLGTTWNLTRSSASVNQIASPDGTLNADKLIENTSNNTHLAWQSISVVNGQKIAISIFAKKGERSELLFVAEGSAGPVAASAWFDLDSGTKGTVGAGASDSGMDAFPNGWYRCWLVFTADQTSTFDIGMFLGIASEDKSYTGDGSSGLYLWGIQCEENVSFPSSYIKTTTASVTRAVDDIRYDNTSEVNLKALAGTFYIAHTPEYDGADLADNGVLFDCRVSDAADGWFVQVQASSDNYYLIVKSGGSNVVSLSSAVAAVRGTTVIVCITWKANEFTIFIGGVQKAQDTSGNAPAAVNPSMFLGQNRSNGKPDSANLAHLHIYDSAHDAARVLKNTKEIQAWLNV